MAERRSLVDGVKMVERAAEESFVFAGKKAEPPTVAPANGQRGPVERLPFSSRIRADMALALKRASLERQLAGVYPNSLQEMVEEALEPWLKAHGYLP